MIRKLSLSLALTASLIACDKQDNQSVQPENYRPRYEFNVEPQDICVFKNAKQLEDYLRSNIEKQVPRVLETYNKKFNTNYPPQSIEIIYETFKNENTKYPKFYYMFDEHKLHLEFIPAKDADNYIKFTCMDLYPYHWDLYKDLSIGVVPHEIGHWYHGEFMKRNSIVWKPEKDHTPKAGGASLVGEGVAVYLGSLIDPSETSVNEEDYENPYVHLMELKHWNRWVYPAGEKLVRPILDKNFHLGLKLMSENLPEPKTADDIVMYQNEILKQLDK